MNHYRPHILVFCVLAVVLMIGAQKPLQNALTDARFGWFPREATGDIVVVAIDSRSIEKVGVWPWPRQIHADLISRLRGAGATDIVFDVDFSSPSTEASDQAFLKALQKAGGSIVLPAFSQWVGTGEERLGGYETKAKVPVALYVNRPLPQFGKAAWSAIVNVALERDGLARKYSFGEILDGEFLPSVGALLSGRYETKKEPLQIDFSIRPDSVPVVPYVDVLTGSNAALSRLDGKKVIIGSTAVELGDRFNVPNGRVISGPLLQVLAAESILQDRALRSFSDAVNLGGLILIALLVLLLDRASAGWRVSALVGVAVIAEAIASLLQVRFAIVLETSLWNIAIASYLVTIALDEIDFRRLLSSIAERKFQRIAMSLGDGLVCADRDARITVWNPGAIAIFGYQPAEMIGQPLTRLCRVQNGDCASAPFSLLALSADQLQLPSGSVMELVGLRKSGESFPLEVCFSAWQGVDGLQYGAVMRDISVRKRELERIRYLSEHDTLTDLANRNALYLHLNARLSQADASLTKVALLIFDLDKFKQINDTLGHACGDELLRAVANRLSDLAEAGSLVARLSGDEFAVVVSETDATVRAEKLAERVSLSLGEAPFMIGERQLRITATVGQAIYPDHASTADELVGNADLALFRAKSEGHARHVVFDHRIRDELEANLALEAEFAGAMNRNELELFYQPQVRLDDGKVVGAEALIRWRHPQRGLVSPSEFMPLVNTLAISEKVGLWVLETACSQGRRWQDSGHEIRLGVNLSPSQLHSGDIAATVEKVLRESGYSPALLELEVTEDILLDDDQRVIETFRRIQDTGAQIAFDDFGTGYASMTYLKKFPINRLKIDRSFVSELLVDSGDAAIVSCTLTLGKMLGMSIIAEGIENKATAELLARMGCEEGQGYYFAPPMTAPDFERIFLNADVVSAAGPIEHESTAA